MTAPVEFRTNASVYMVLSHSTDDKRYRVVLGTEPAYDTCTCPAFKYRSPQCKHIAEARAFASSSIVQGPPTVLGTGFSIEDIGGLFVRALTWVDDDPKRAAGLVEAYIKGAQGVEL